ncbi:MAG: hypothetical protein CL878_03525 [Dehalococcoidia bacterium]|nr:hypothetical protein [Dehalococcoidia bacterium]
MQYLLDQVTDPRGNRLTVTYDIVVSDLDWNTVPIHGYARAIYPREIRYTDHEGSPAAGERRVLFDRASRNLGGTDDYESDTEHNNRVGAGKAAETQRFFAEDRLWLISTWKRPDRNDPAGWKAEHEVQRWELDHSYLATTHTGADSYKNRLMLDTITPLAAGGSPALPTTTYSYDALGLLTTITNGYGGEVSYTYEGHQADGQGTGGSDYSYNRVKTRTVKSGMTNGGASGPEEHVTTYSYAPVVPVGSEPVGASLFGSTPGHSWVEESDAVGVIRHDFQLWIDSKMWGVDSSGDGIYEDPRPGLRGRETRTAARLTSGGEVQVHTRTWDLRRSSRSVVADSSTSTKREDSTTEIQAVTLAAEEWHSSDGTGAQAVRTEYGYDSYSNQVRASEHGDMAVSGDERTIVRQFAPNTGSWLLGGVTTETVHEGVMALSTESYFGGGSSANVALRDCANLDQSFSPQVSGVLQAVALRLREPGDLGPSPPNDPNQSAPLNGTLLLRVFTDNSGSPGTELGQIRKASRNVVGAAWHWLTPTSDGTLTGALVPVTKDATYWLRLTGEGGSSIFTGPRDVHWEGGTADYPRGTANPNGSGCNPNPVPSDFQFQAQVLPDLAASTALVETLTSYDTYAHGVAPTEGLPTRVEQRDAQNTALTSVTLTDYDAYGQPTRVTLLANPATENKDDSANPVTRTEYDDSYKTFPEKAHVWLAHSEGNPTNILTTLREFDKGTGQVTQVTDPNGAFTTYDHDDFGRLLSVRRPGNETGLPTVAYTYYYTGAPNRLRIVEKDGTADGGRHTVQFYDGLGRLIETKTELTDNVSSQGRHSVVRQLYTDRNLVATAYVPWGTPAQNSSDFLTKFEYVENEADQPFTTTTYDGAGRVTQVTAPDGSVTTRVHRDGSRLLTDARGRQRVEHTDGFGRLSKVEEYGGVVPQVEGVWQTTRHEAGDPNDPAITYVGQNWHTGTWYTTQPSSGGNMRYALTIGEYAEFTFTGPNVTWVGGTNSNAGTARVTIDGQPAAWVAGADGVRQPLTDGLVSTWSAAQTSQVPFVFGDLGPGSHTIRMTYHSGSAYVLVDAFDVPGGPYEDTTTTYAYDGLGNLTTVTDDANNQTVISYDGLGRKTQVQDPDTGTWSYAYDGLGQLETQTDAKSQTLTFKYDLAGRLDLQKHGSTVLADHGYDAGGAGANALGRRTSLTDASGSTTWAYDNRGRVTSQTQTILGTAYTTGWSYDSLDRPVTLTYPDSEVVTTSYGAHGQPVSVVGAQSYVTGATYSDQLQPLGWTYGNSTTASFDYYDTGNAYDAQLASLGPLGWWKLKEASGNIQNTGSLSGIDGTPNGTPDYEQTGPSSTIPYGINFSGSGEDFRIPDVSGLRLTGNHTLLAWIKPDTVAAGNGTILDKEGNSSGYWLIRNGSALYTGFGNGSSFQKHFSGSVLSAGQWAFVASTWDGTTSRLYVNGSEVSALAMSGNPVGNTNNLALGSNGLSSPGAYFDGTIAQAAVFDTVLTAQQLANLYTAGTTGSSGEIDPDGVVQPRDYRLKQLTYRDSQSTLLQQQSYRYDRVGNITGWWQQDRTTGPWRWDATYDERDRLTSAVVTSPPAGASPTSFSYAYDSIGNLTSGPLGSYTYGDSAHVHAATAGGTFASAAFHAPFGDTWHTQGSLATDHRYTGQRSLESSLGSLYHYQARWYSPVLGRFLSPDPIVPEPGNPQDLNRYAYVRNSPYVYIDPSGYDPLDQKWRDGFREKYGRDATADDELIRLYVIAGLGEESHFYDANGFLKNDTIIRDTFRAHEGRTWQQLAGTLEHMKRYYEQGESEQFMHDFATLFAGFEGRSGASLGGVVRSLINPFESPKMRDDWVWLDPESLDSAWTGGQVDGNVRHFAGFAAVGYALRIDRAQILNVVREVVFANGWAEFRADARMGNAGAAFGNDLAHTYGVLRVGTQLRYNVAPLR